VGEAPASEVSVFQQRSWPDYGAAELFLDRVYRPIELSLIACGCRFSKEGKLHGLLIPLQLGEGNAQDPNRFIPDRCFFISRSMWRRISPASSVAFGSVTDRLICLLLG